MARFQVLTRVIVIGCFLGIPLLCFADWPTINGNSQHNGFGRWSGPAIPNEMWSGGAAQAWFGGPIFIEGNRIITMRFNGLENTPIVCYDLHTGAELWRVNFTGHNSRALPIGAQDGMVYAVNFCESQHDTLYALSVVDGSMIWRSEQKVHIGITFSAVFVSGGDLIIPGDNYRLVRINHLTGNVMWSTPRLLPVVGGSEHLVVFLSRVYGWQGTITSPKQLTAWNTNTGAELYHIDLPGDGDQEIPLTCGLESTIFAQRDGGLLYAIRDTGTEFEIVWSHAVSGTPYAGYGAMDPLSGNIIVPDSNQLVALNTATGQEVARSVPLVSSSRLNPRSVIGFGGILYVSNGGAEDGALFALNSTTLDSLWSVPVPNIVYSGPAMSDSGDLVVSGSGNTMIALQGSYLEMISVTSPSDSSNVGRDSIQVSWREILPAGDNGRIVYHISYYTWRSDGLVNALEGIPGPDTVRWESAEGLLGSRTLGGNVDWMVWAEDTNHVFIGQSAMHRFTIDPATSVDETQAGLPSHFSITSVYPNPFNSATRLTLSLPAATHLRVSLFDLLGREIAVVSDGAASAGVITLPIDASRWTSGTYFLHARTGRGECATQKILLVK